MPLKTYKRQVNKDPKRDGPKARWSEKQKYEAVALYKMVGSLRAVAGTLGVPEETLRNWHQSDWWKQVEDDIATEARVKRGKKLDKLVDKAMELVEDRLENGDYQYDPKTGKLIRRPINALTASKILQTAVDKQVLLDNLAKEEKKAVTQDKLENRLAFLLDEMQRFAKARDITAQSERLEGGDPNLLVEVIEDAVYEEREEGLQEGIGVGAQEGDPSAGRSSGPEQGQRSDDGSRQGAEG